MHVNYILIFNVSHFHRYIYITMLTNCGGTITRNEMKAVELRSSPAGL